MSKKVLDETIKRSKNNKELITTEKVYQLMEQLYSLKYFGLKMKEMKQTLEIKINEDIDSSKMPDDQVGCSQYLYY